MAFSNGVSTHLLDFVRKQQLSYWTQDFFEVTHTRRLSTQLHHWSFLIQFYKIENNLISSL